MTHVRDASGQILQSPFVAKERASGSVGQHLLNCLNKFGNKTALVEYPSGKEWSGLEARDSILQIASVFLNEVGLKVGDVVCFYANHTAFHAMALIGVMAVGGVYTSVADGSPIRELVNIARDTGAAYIMTEERLLSNAVKVARDLGTIKKIFVINSNELKATPTDVACELFNNLLTADRNKSRGSAMIPVRVEPATTCASLMFTTGTTGKPKPIVLTHQNYEQRIFEDLKLNDLEEGTPVMIGPHFSHDAIITIFFLTLGFGCKSMLIPYVDGGAFDDVLATLERAKVEVAIFVPSELKMLSESSRFVLPDLKEIFVVGSALPPAITKTMQAKNSRVNIRQTYGSTEMGFVTIATRSVSLTNPKTVGTLIPGLEMKIVDIETKACLGLGQVGEVCIRGSRITPGYYKLPEKTAETFYEGGFFRTGDAGYFDENGLLYLTHRYKDVIKVFGTQASPIEIEEVLLGHESVAEAAVVGILDDDYGEVPKAFVVKKKGHNISAEALIKHVADTLDWFHQIRGGLVFKDSFPKSPLGKIRKAQLNQEN